MKWASGPGFGPEAVFSCPISEWKGGCSPIMDAILPSVDERDAETALRQTITSLKGALLQFEILIAKVGALDETVTDTEVNKTIIRLRETFGALTRERQRFEKEVNGRSGDLRVEPIDLDAARTEVGRLLDSLRAAGSAADVPGEPQP